MKLIYVHHAHRKNGKFKSQNDDITKLGKQDAKIVAELLAIIQERGTTVKAIYSSPFKRCLKTANIINKKIKAKIITEDRFNEAGSIVGESWLDVQYRMREAIYDIVCKYKDDDCVVCVTSGVNVVAFMQLVFKGLPSQNAPFIGLPSCSPMVFDITKDNFF